MTPYDALFKVKPSYEQIKVFGCLYYVHNYKSHKDKFGVRGREYVFIGYPHDKEGRKVYDIEIGDKFVSRDVIFQEDIFPLAEAAQQKKITSDGMNFVDDFEEIRVEPKLTGGDR